MRRLFVFSKEMRLSRKSDISRVFKKGKLFRFKDEKLFVLCNGMNLNRFLCTFRRGFGKAVCRNRVRRVSKEVYRSQIGFLKQGFDIVLLASRFDCSFYAWKDKIVNLFKVANLLANPFVINSMKSCEIYQGKDLRKL